ncbi:MAG: cysteine--tRNA ligase [Patescibacteria group bacterium]
MYNIKIYNTLSGEKDVLKPFKKNRINLFVCGPTVYDFSHIGHARTYIIFDCFVKYLKQLGFKVFYLQNITDVDDKIILRAKEKEVLPQDLALAYEREYLKDMKAVGITSVSKYARATDYVKETINQIERLLEKGYAYKLDDGVYFDIKKFKNYGELSGRTALQADDAVSRIDYSKGKRNRGDFCLWKLISHKNEPGWPSPFGQGRPGWHIEDTAITEKFFGAQYDIHGGGRDLIFPHHEAEVAQIESISGKRPMAKYWMHTGFLTTDGQKMSKSLNNFLTVNNFLKRYPVELLRFYFAKNLWRSPIDYSESSMVEAKYALEKIEEFIRKIKNQKLKIKNTNKKFILKKFKDEFYKNLADDFNTPKAFAVIFNLIKEANKLLDKNPLSKKNAKEIYDFFEEINKIFSIIDSKKLKQSSIPEEVKSLLKGRENYRKNKEWDKADEVRKEIEKYRYAIEDTKDGPVLKKI